MPIDRFTFPGVVPSISLLAKQHSASVNSSAPREMVTIQTLALFDISLEKQHQKILHRRPLLNTKSAAIFLNEVVRDRRPRLSVQRCRDMTERQGSQPRETGRDSWVIEFFTNRLSENCT
jgi:hypothetical protein